MFDSTLKSAIFHELSFSANCKLILFVNYAQMNHTYIKKLLIYHYLDVVL